VCYRESLIPQICQFIAYRFPSYCLTTGHCERSALLNFKRFSLARPLHKHGLPLFPLRPAIQIRRGLKAGMLVLTCTGTSIPGFSFTESSLLGRPEGLLPPLLFPRFLAIFRPLWLKPEGRKMRQLIGFMIAYALYVGALWFFLQSADLSIRVIA